MVLNRDAKHKMMSAENDAVYVARGAAKVIQYDVWWEGDLQEQNKGKVGRPYKFADSMMCAIALWKATRGGSYRDCWGSEDLWEEPYPPLHHHVEEDGQ